MKEALKLLKNYFVRNNEHIAAAESTSETKKATLALLRTLIILLQTLRPLPDDVMLTMKLLYYDEGKVIHGQSTVILTRIVINLKHLHF